METGGGCSEDLAKHQDTQDLAPDTRNLSTFY